MRSALVLALLVGCGGSKVSELTIEHDPDFPGVAWVSWTSKKAGTSVVEYGEGDFTSTTPAGAEGTEHRIQVRGLKLDGDYQIRGVTTVEDKVFETDPIDFGVPPGRADVPYLERKLWEPDLACEDGGYIMGSVLNFQGGGNSWVVIWDREGTPVWAYPSDGEWLVRVRPSRDGNGLIWMHNDATRVDDFGKITKIGFDGVVESETRALWAHHDFVEHSDGTLAWLSYEFFEGFDVPGRGIEDMATDAIYEAQPGAGETDYTVAWSVMDDYGPGIYDPPDVTDFEAGFLPGYWEFSHANSLMMSEDHAQYAVMFRWLDTLAMIDRASKDTDYLFGGPDNDLAGNDADLYSHAHMSEIWDAGNGFTGVLMFDNADVTGGVSGVAEYMVSESSGTFERTFEYRDPEGKLEALLGDAIRVPVEGCNNIMVAWSTKFRIQEITRDGTPAMGLQAPDGWIISRLTYLPDLYNTGY